LVLSKIHTKLGRLPVAILHSGFISFNAAETDIKDFSKSFNSV